uniref:Si:dkey-118j18.2 n=1 Tax=Xiphophorus couchianus TaxID=32473 RepID=A0A3B5LJP6_9TELE
TYFSSHRVVIIFIIIKIFFYVCWYRSRQRQLAAYLSNTRNAQIVIVGGRAYLHQMCERQNQASVWPSWYGVQEDFSVEEPSSTMPPTASFSHLEMPPPYEVVSGALTTFLVRPTEESTGGQHDAASMFYVEGSVFRGMCCVYFLPLMVCFFVFLFLSCRPERLLFFFSHQTRAPSAKFIAFSKSFFLPLFRKGQIYRVHKLLSTTTI